MTGEQERRIRAQIDSAADKLARRLDGPLLIMYYPEEASIDTEDVAVFVSTSPRVRADPRQPIVGTQRGAAYRRRQCQRILQAGATDTGFRR